MDETRLDGNGVAGTLAEIFVHEMTSARVECGSCGRVEPVGAEHAYVQAPSVVLRCCHCDGVLLVVTRKQGRYLVGFPGSRWLEFAREGPTSA
jgi:Family of unknown function (DUF6510)